MNKADLKAVLRKNKWFAGLPPSLADSILHLGRVRTVEGSLIYSATDCRDGLLALVSGQVRLTSFSRSGNPSFLLITSPGSWIGVTSALDGRPYGYDAFAIGKTVLFHLSQERFEALVGESNDNYSAFVRMVCDHLRVSIQNLIIVRNRRPLCRLAQELSRLAERHGRQTKKGLVIDLRLSQEDLAVMIGVGRQTINRLLKSLEQDGIATAKYTSITIHKLETIERLSLNEAVDG
ncbi:Crp/Fnr family transcriptional regulator [Bradyrhizobium manausense]|uniref:Crp/Fnr family transcriptional regulator n=1 Tax=Bradyrhizobium TaxID=374 RepID=UPI001BABC21A|nr:MULTISPECIES: Crp/Fnr family transcriptional regulator [Bradyrhizobium]MBR0825668.1 Crp/Fnr family transcriptional regulator [Bradyrhizobium manausense]UVO31380.1 Crp/Fnr family transcriptional regulator [Bradyrhizobium arachidis]